MLTATTHITPQFNAATAAKIVTRGQGPDRELLSESVIALAARCAQ